MRLASRSACSRPSAVRAWSNLPNIFTGFRFAWASFHWLSPCLKKYTVFSSSRARVATKVLSGRSLRGAFFFRFASLIKVAAANRRVSFFKAALRRCCGSRGTMTINAVRCLLC